MTNFDNDDQNNLQKIVSKQGSGEINYKTTYAE